MAVFAQDNLTYIFCTIIVAFFIGAWWYLHRKTKCFANEIEELNTQLCQVRNTSEIDEDGELVVHKWVASPLTSTFQNYKQIDQLISATKCLNRPWKNYQRSMQEPGINFELSENQAPSLRNTIATEKVFSFSEVFDTLINVRFLTSVPGKLTGLGLLFTFIGLMIGISEASVGLSSNDIAAAKNSLTPLLNGASIAFTTSVVGLILSMIFSIIEKHSFHHLDIMLANFANLINERIDFVDADKLASMQLLATQVQTKALSSFQFDQQRITDETITRVADEFRKTLTESAGTELGLLSVIISQMSEGLSSNIESLGANQSEIHGSTNNLVKLLDETITKLHSSSVQNASENEASFSRISTEFENSMQKIGESLNKKQQSNFDTTSEMVQQLDKTINSLQLGAEKTTALVEASFSRISLEFDNSMSRSRESLNKEQQSNFDSTSGLVKNLDNTINRLNEGSEKATKLIEASFSRICTEFENSMSKGGLALNNEQEKIIDFTSGLLQQLDDTVKKLYENSEKTSDLIESSFLQTSANFEESMQKSGEDFSKKSAGMSSNILLEMQKTSFMVMDEFVTNTTNKLEHALTNITAGISSNESPLTALITTLPQSVASIIEVNKSVTGTLSGLEQAQGALSEIFNGAKTIVRQLTESSGQLIDSNGQALAAGQIYSQLIASVKSVSDAGAKSATSVEQSVTNLLDVFESQKSKNGELGVTMANLFNDLENGMRAYSSQTNKYMEGLDKHTAGISQNLVEAISELRITLTDFQAERMRAYS